MYKLSIITADGILETKLCKDDYQAYVFARDMPAKHGLLYSGKAYIIKTIYL